VIKKQLIILKLNPILIDGVNVTGNTESDWSSRCSERKPIEMPTNKLNAGPAKFAVVAMSGMPLRAMATLAERSPREFPQARTVTPRIGAGILQIVPRNWSNPTKLLPITSIHVAAMKKPYKDSGTCWWKKISLRNTDGRTKTRWIILRVHADIWIQELTAATRGNFSSLPKQIIANAVRNASKINIIDEREKSISMYHMIQKGDIAVDNAAIVLL